jgi:hypothetical protein
MLRLVHTTSDDRTEMTVMRMIESCEIIIIYRSLHFDSAWHSSLLPLVADRTRVDPVARISIPPVSGERAHAQRDARLAIVVVLDDVPVPAEYDVLRRFAVVRPAYRIFHCSRPSSRQPTERRGGKSERTAGVVRVQVVREADPRACHVLRERGASRALAERVLRWERVREDEGNLLEMRR